MISRLIKVEGAGNDFLLGVGRWSVALAGNEDLVRRLCNRRFGVGADGALAVDRLDDDRVRLVYRNADGGKARFCANGTRCAARAAVDLLGCSTDLSVDTGWGPIAARVRGTQVALDLPKIETAVRLSGVGLPAPFIDGWFVEVGVPHVVVRTAAIADLDLASAVPELRSLPEVGRPGANINVFVADGVERVVIRSWELGVEGETLCCGSGVVAVALSVMAENDRRTVTCVPMSGDLMTVEAVGKPPLCASRLTGPARTIAEIRPTSGLPEDY